MRHVGADEVDRRYLDALDTRQHNRAERLRFARRLIEEREHVSERPEVLTVHALLSAGCTAEALEPVAASLPRPDGSVAAVHLAPGDEGAGALKVVNDHLRRRVAGADKAAADVAREPGFERVGDVAAAGTRHPNPWRPLTQMARGA